MPLFLRHKRDHYLDQYADRRFSDGGYIVLSGAFVAGSMMPSRKLREEHRWDWSGGFGEYRYSGTVDTIEEGKQLIAGAFRNAITRVGLQECADAKAGPPERDPPPPTTEQVAAWSKEKPYDRWFDGDHPTVIHNLRRIAVYSGELMIGLLNELGSVPVAGQWTWALFGTRPNPADFVWKGQEKTIDEARAALDACWAAWIAWAGLEQREPTRWKSS